SALALAQAAGSACARLARLGPDSAPERLFGALLELAGALTAFAAEPSQELPAYLHADAGPGFAVLEALLRERLEAVASLRVARLDAAVPGPGGALYLSARAEMPLAALIEAVPARLKLGAPDDLDRLVHSAVAGVRLVHAAQWPAALPLAPGACCFLVEPQGPWYERLLQARALAVHVPDGLPGLRLGLHALLG
ncbi:type VI secretion system baseplate subunit TssK, partial [Rubrivivax gelatinosus]|uniref:type VI secretion system baseplate subunit TssK n=1 Tax=Rubrivivax gelatinosus TaxID=28068 RepID=UPI0005C14CF0